MLSNYITLAFRNLRQNSRYFLINVLGLGVALAFGILAWLNYRFANTYDTHHPDAGRIVRVELIKQSNNELYGVCPAALGPAAVDNIPAVEAMCRYDSRGTVVKNGDQVLNENLYFADENFFQFFHCPVLKGQIDLQDRSKVIIDEPTAEKYFGQDDPIGKPLVFYAETEHKLTLSVGAVVKKIPLNSSLRFRFLTHLDNQLDAGKATDYVSWKFSVDAVFLRLKSMADRQNVATAIQAFVAPRNTARPDWMVSGYKLEPMLEMAHTSRFLRANALWQGVPPAAVWGNLVMAIMLLLTASLNFANMTIGVCNRRLREIGVRKVMGGTRFQLIRQLLSESFVVVVAATALGMVLAYPVVDWFNATWKFTDLHVDYTNTELIVYVAFIALFTTFLAGSYPAFYISSFQPSHIFRGGVLFGGNNAFSKVMMGLQVVISVVSVVVGLSFARNADYNRNADIGFDYQPLLQAWLPQPNDFQRFEQMAKGVPGVEAIAGSQHLPGFGYTRTEFDYNNARQEALLYQIGNDLPRLMQFHLEQGAWPSPAGDTSASTEVLVNATFARSIGGNQRLIGELIPLGNQQCRISGVVSDFITQNPFTPLSPAIIRYIPARDYQRCIIRTTSVAVQPAVMAALEKEWKTLFPYSPFNVGYQSEMVAEAVEVSDNIAESMAFFSIVAIILCITGLFSLVSLNVLRRLRELSIRRVLGASAGQITWILNRNYILIFSGSIVIGCALGRVLALKLMDSIFKINYGVTANSLVFSALVVLVIAFCTIGIKIWQTLRMNPAEVLRN